MTLERGNAPHASIAPHALGAENAAIPERRPAHQRAIVGTCSRASNNNSHFMRPDTKPVRTYPSAHCNCMYASKSKAPMATASPIVAAPVALVTFAWYACADAARKRRLNYARKHAQLFLPQPGG